MSGRCSTPTPRRPCRPTSKAPAVTGSALVPFQQRPRAPDAPALTDDEARELCLRLLEVRARSRSELTDRLRIGGADPQTAERVLDRLVEVGLVDDDAYAAALARGRRAQRGLSRRALTGELRRRGLDEAVVAEAVEAAAQEPEHEVALRLAQRRRGALAHLPPDVQRRRLSGYLARRGYGFDVVGPVCAQVLVGEVDTDDADDALEQALQHAAETGPE